MAIYIKGIEMPKGCGAVTLKVWPDGEVEIIDEDGEWKTTKAIPVPEHGDLIDKSGVEVLSWYKKDEGDFEDGVLFVLDKLDELPIIIPAEEDEE